MTLYRFTLPPVDSEFYGEKYDTSGNVPGWQPGRPRTMKYVPLDEAVEKIREVAYPVVNEDGTITVEIECDGGQYELAITIKDLESELNAMQYWQHSLCIEKPQRVRTKVAVAK